jgi:hypothetical protein
MHHGVQLHNGAMGGSGILTTFAIACLGLAIGWVLDGHPTTRRLVPLVQPTIERLSRHHHTTALGYDNPSDYQPPNHPAPTPHPQQLSIHDTTPTPTPKTDIVVYPTTVSSPTYPHSQPAYECPLTGNILYLNIPPNAHLSFIFAILAMALHTIFLRCNVLRHRRELDFLLHLQNQIHTKTTTVSEAARHCKTSEAAIKAWLRNFDEFASGPAADGDDN